MKLKRVYFDNYSSYKKKEIKFKDINFIIGANGVGKSKIIESFKIIQAYLNNRLTEFQHKNYVFDKNKKLQVILSFDFSLNENERNSLIDFVYSSSTLDLAVIFKSGFASSVRFRVNIDNKGIKNEVIRISNTENGWLTIINKKPETDTTLNTNHVQLIEKGDSKRDYTNLSEAAETLPTTPRLLNRILDPN